MRQGAYRCSICPWLQAPGLPTANSTQADISWRWQVRTTMAWYSGSPHARVQREPLRFAIQKHLGLPLFAPGQRCLYTPLTTGRRCHHALGAYSDHAFTCAQGPGVRRRNRLRDSWIALCRKAGWHVDAEQLVYIAPGETKRADFVALTPDGQRLACDIMVTASPTPWAPHGPHLHTAAAANTTPGGFMHDRSQFLPLLHDAHNHWLSAEALRLLHRLTTAKARQTAPGVNAVWHAHLDTTSIEAASALMSEAILSSWRMHATCGRML